MSFPPFFMQYKLRKMPLRRRRRQFLMHKNKKKNPASRSSFFALSRRRKILFSSRRCSSRPIIMRVAWGTLILPSFSTRRPFFTRRRANAGGNFSSFPDGSQAPRSSPLPLLSQLDDEPGPIFTTRGGTPMCYAWKKS